jgi:pyridoxine 5-phosphate synthase
VRQNRIRLGVNIDHVATLRQVRGGTTSYPDVLEQAKVCAQSGCDQITIHLREDQRHIQLHDLITLSEHCPVDLNLEMAVTPKMLRLANQYKPEWCCFVPEKRKELTTEGGLDVIKNKRRIAQAIEKLQARGVEISLFIGPDLAQVKAAFEVGADAVEFHTGHWVQYKGDKKKREWLKLKRAALMAHHLGMRVHAGHGLDFKHAQLIRSLPYLKEVNIGHFLVCESMREGLGKAVKKMIHVLKS